MYSVSRLLRLVCGDVFSVEASISAYFRPLLGADVYTSGVCRGRPIVLDSLMLPRTAYG